MRHLSYDRQTVNSPNPLARYAHRRRLAIARDLASLALPRNGTIVDVGAGPGTLLSAIAEQRPDVTLYAMERFMARSSDLRINYIESFPALPGKVDAVTAFEVCEHFSDEEIADFVRFSHAAIRPTGQLIVSVPIMVGAAVPVKELSRSIIGRRRSEYVIAELVTALFGGSVARPLDRKPTHKGFDFRILREDLGKKFFIRREFYSPLPLPWWMNSQAFFICAPK